MKIALRGIVLIVALCLSTRTLHAAELPHIKMENGTGQLIVNGQPYLILGGELGNSSAGTQAQADPHRLHIFRVRLYSLAPEQRH